MTDAEPRPATGAEPMTDGEPRPAPGGEPAPGAEPATGGGSSDLLALADLDTSIARIRHQRATMPERKQLGEAGAALAALTDRAAALDAERSALVGRQLELDEQAGAVGERCRILEQRLYSARGSSSRDLQAIEGEIGHLRQRQSEFEETELELMMAQEPLDAALTQIATEKARLEEAAGLLKAAVAAADVVAGAELSALEASRGLLVAGMPPDLIERYETIGARLGGVGAARLVGNRCDGCHLELPSVEVERVRHLPPGTVAACDQCGRLLVVPSAAEPTGD